MEISQIINSSNPFVFLMSLAPLEFRNV
ncbi:MAG: hypothetical protein ACJASZ_002592, partial [Yoonia sp.]